MWRYLEMGVIDKSEFNAKASLLFIRNHLNRNDINPNDVDRFIEDVEHLAADTYGHKTIDGWCCACDADIAFAEQYLRETKPELFK